MEGEHGADAHKNHDVSSNVSPPPCPRRPRLPSTLRTAVSAGAAASL